MLPFLSNNTIQTRLIDTCLPCLPYVNFAPFRAHSKTDAEIDIFARKLSLNQTMYVSSIAIEIQWNRELVK